MGGRFFGSVSDFVLDKYFRRQISGLEDCGADAESGFQSQTGEATEECEIFADWNNFEDNILVMRADHFATPLPSVVNFCPIVAVSV